MSPRGRMLAGFIAANTIIVAIALVVLQNRPEAPPLIQGVLLPEGRTVAPFSLLDHGGNNFTNNELRGRWHMVSYGFTTCPDICPTTLYQLADVANSLQGSGKGTEDDLRVLFYSVDHRRDTVAQMASYVPYFHPAFVGLTHVDDADNPHLPFEKSLGIAAQLIPITGTDVDPAANEYEVSHGITLFLINPDGELQAIFEPDRITKSQHSFNPEQVLKDYLAIRKYLG
jgi:protein SCO1